MKKILFIAAFVFSSSALGASNACEANFVEDGGFFSGKTFKTWGEFPQVGTAKAYKKVYLFTVKNGYKIVQADKEMGIISASQDVSYGEGKTAPLNIVVEESGKAGSKVSMTFSTSGGVVAPSDAVKDYFCQTLAEVK